MNFPTLYHKGKNGAVHSWKIWTKDDTIFSEHGQVDGKKQVSSKKATPKNEGKANATTASKQADSEAASMHKYKLDRKYSLTPEKAKEPVLLPMLAQDFEKRKKKDVVYPGDVQPKLDGVRCLARWEGKSIKLISRNGKTYNCPHITKELEKFLPEDMVLDGELYVHGTGFQTISSWVKKLRPETARIQYHVYDVPECNGEDEQNWSQRNQILKMLNLQAKMDEIKSIEFVKSITVKNEKEVYQAQESFVKDGYEGAIFRNLNGLYQYGYRSYDLLKVKSFDDAEFEIIGFTDGVGKDAGTVIWNCKTKKGDVFAVRPKGAYEDREQYFKNGKKYIGQMLKVKYFGMTDEGVPRFPIGLGFRLEQDV